MEHTAEKWEEMRRRLAGYSQSDASYPELELPLKFLSIEEDSKK